MSFNESSHNTVVIVDGGGRGAALVDAYAKSPHVGRIIAVPGNDLMHLNTDKPVTTRQDLKTTSISQILELCEDERVSLIDVAQDNAVAVGLADATRAKGFLAVGPSRLAGEVEWNKAFARNLGRDIGLSQPAFTVWDSPRDAIDYALSTDSRRRAVKAAFLAEGKGVIESKDNDDIEPTIVDLVKRFPQATEIFLLEDWLANDDGTSGEEFSSYAISDGSRFRIIGHAQDHKLIQSFDKGENTGGMGAVSPPLVFNEQLSRQIEQDIFQKTFNELMLRNRPYNGILYLGGILLKQSGHLQPYVVEFNARWGDPEAQVVVPSIKTDFYELNIAAALGNIRNVDLKTDGKTRVAIAIASRGYPGDYSAVKGKQIYGIEEVIKTEGVTLYGAGVKAEDGNYYATGGRLLYVVGEGNNIIEAKVKAAEAASYIYVAGNNGHYRIDIGWRDIERYHQ